MMENGGAAEAKAQELLDSVYAALPKAVKQLELASSNLPVDQDFHFTPNSKEVNNRVVTALSQITSSNEFCPSTSESTSLSKPWPADSEESYDELIAVQDELLEQVDAFMEKSIDEKKEQKKPELLISRPVPSQVLTSSKNVKVARKSPTPFHLEGILSSFTSFSKSSSADSDDACDKLVGVQDDLLTRQEREKFVWRRSAQVSPKSQMESPNNSLITKSLKSLSPTSATLLEPGPSCADANSGSSSAPPTFSDESTPQFPNKFIYRPPVRTVPAASSPEVRKVRIRCSKCGSKSHLWKGCPSDGKCARCSDPENEQPCATVVIRTRMMKDCRDSGDLSKMWTLLRSLKSDGHKPTVHSYSILLSFLVWKGKMQEARKVWETMDEDGVAADAICYNTLLNGWCSAGKLDEAKAVLKEMRTRKFQLTTSTYNTLIKGLGLAGRPAEAMKVLEQMTLKDTAEPNRQTYNILINAWAQVKDIEQARRVLQLMRNAGLSPDVVTYNSLAKAYAELERSFEAEQVINEMKDVYIRPNERTYGIVINSYCETGRPEEGLALLDRMRMDGIRCNLPIYNILIKGFAQLYRPDKVDEVLELMGASGVKPDVQSFSLAMNVWSSAGLVEEARAIFERMQRDYELRPDVTAYTILAKGYVRARRPAEAESLLLEMTDQGLRPNVFTFTTVISGWCNVGNMEEAYRVFKSMETCGVRPNSNTVSTLIWGFSESKQPHRAEEVVEDMKARGIEIDRKCLDLVAEAWRSVGLPAEARRVLRGEVNTATMSSESTLKTRFDSMIAGREILLDSNIHTRVNKEPVFADKQSSLKPPATALTSTVKLRANITAKSLQQRTPCVDPKLKNQVVTVGDKYTRRTLQIRNRLNCREVLVRTSNSIVTLRRATPWVSLVIV